ncbi:MAG: competence protein ComK [Bacilli bacterium]|nr:competence protein ComK [Bacilli bacterium]
MENLEISKKTCALSFKDQNSCLLLEGNKEYNVNMSLQAYINYNCEYYGSSFEGRIKGAKKSLGMKYKLPIVIEESREIVFFPTKSYNSEKCTWISLNNISKYEGNSKKTIITFNSGIKKQYDISIESFENQMLRATKLLLTLKNRKLELK